MESQRRAAGAQLVPAAAWRKLRFVSWLLEQGYGRDGSGPIDFVLVQADKPPPEAAATAAAVKKER